MNGWKAMAPRGLAILWIVAACVGSLWLVLHYAFQVFGGLPVYDDWPFLEQVRQFNQRQIGIDHIFLRHNGHPSVPSRLAYLLVYRFDGLNLAPLRWTSLIGNIASAVLVSAMMIRAAQSRPAEQGPDGQPKWRPRIDVLHPAILVGVPVSTALFLSLGQWETYSVAMCVGNVIVTLSAMLAIFAFDFWLKRRRAVWFVMALLMATIATFSMTQGMICWLVFSGMIWFSPDGRRLQRLALVFGVIFLITLVWNVIGFAGGSGIGSKKDLGHFIIGLFLVLGVPVFGLIANKVLLPWVLTGGLLLAPGVGFAAASIRWINAATLARALPFLGVLAYGLGSIALIVWGRQILTFEAIAAARYALLGLPALIGALGVLAILAERSRWAERFIAATAALCVLGLVVTNEEENVMGFYRASLFKDLDTGLRDPAVVKDQAWFEQHFYLNDKFAHDAVTVLPFLRAQHQSIFGKPPPPAPTK